LYGLTEEETKIIEKHNLNGILGVTAVHPNKKRIKKCNTTPKTTTAVPSG